MGNILGCLWKQLALWKGYSEILRASYDMHTKEQSKPNASQLQSSLVEELKDVQQAYIVIDALDECREDVRDQLVPMLQRLSDKCRLLCTSRPLPTNERLLSGYSQLEITASNKDLENYIEGQMNSRSHIVNLITRHPKIEVMKMVKEAVIAKAGGM